MTIEIGVPVVAAGAGLGGLPGLQGWCRSSLEDFVRHSGAEGRENESVGIFVIEPTGVLPAKSGFGAREVAWKARYLALENDLVRNGPEGRARRAFSVGPGQIEAVFRGAEARQDAFFRPLTGTQIQGRRYFPLLGLGHTHPGGSVGASLADLEAFGEWQKMTDPANGLVRGRIVQTNHFVYSFGTFQDTLISLDADGGLSATWTGNFQAAVQ